MVARRYRAGVRPQTEALWARQNRHPGDRQGLFRAVADSIDARRVLYPGCYVDVAASFVFPSVTYVDSDARARRFFADSEGVRELVAQQPGAPAEPHVEFVAGDYTHDLGLAEASFDLLVSLYAGFVSEHCTRYLIPGGWLLVNPSHGDVAMASLDDRYELSGAVAGGSGSYRVLHDDLDEYLVPQRGAQPTREQLHRSGRGIGYTRSAFAYLFTRVR